jgi:hypothetical protein
VARLLWTIALHGFALWGFMDALRLVFAMEWPL